MNLNWLKRMAMVLGAVFAAALVLGAVGLTTSVAQAPDETVADSAARHPQPGDTMVTVLQPGDNLVGWIEARTPVTDLFDAVAEIEVVWAWDVLERRWLAASRHVPSELHTLRTLAPGMGLLVQVGGDEAVEWRRSAYPAAGLTKLHEGLNLVAWSGRGESSIEYLALGIGASFDGAKIWDAGVGHYLGYDPTSSDNADSLPRLRRGEALWVNVSRTVNWLQPTGVSPRVEFPGGMSQSVQDTVRSNLEVVQDGMAAQFGIEADHSSLTVYLPRDAESLIEALGIEDVTQQDFVRADWEEGVSRGGPQRIILRTVGQATLAHEYFHAVQGQLEGADRALATPQWLSEGSAEWFANLIVSGGTEPTTQRAPNQIADCLECAAAMVSRDLTLEDLEVWGPLVYSVGRIAVGTLIGLAGEASFVEFWRLLASTELWATESSPAWWAAFESAFGIAVPDFYGKFGADVQSAVPTRLSGVVVGDDGVAAEGATVTVMRDDDTWSVEAETETGDDGAFTFAIPRAGDYIVAVTPRLGCQAYFGEGGLSTDRSDAKPITITGKGIELGSVRTPVPSSACHFLVTGLVVDENGLGWTGARVSALRFQGRKLRERHTRTSSDGSFELAISAGEWWIQVGIHRCFFNPVANAPATPWSVWNEGRRYRIEAERGGVEDVRVLIPSYACELQIKGRVVYSSGTAFFGQISALGRSVLEDGDNTRPGDVQSGTRSDGSFALAVPFSGFYALEVYVGERCFLYFDGNGNAVRSPRSLDAPTIEVMGTDVEGLVLRIPDDPCG